MSCHYLLLVIQAAVALAARACAAAVAAAWAASAMVTPAALAALLIGALATGPLPVQVNLVIVPCFEKSNVLLLAVSLVQFAAGSDNVSAPILLLLHCCHVRFVFCCILCLTVIS